MKKVKIYKVVAYVSYRDRNSSYTVGKFTSKREAVKCLNSQYQTISRSFDIEEEIQFV